MRERRPRPAVTFLVDTREQWPFRFFPPKRPELSGGVTRRMKLDEGDYSVCLDDGEPLSIRIERKSIGDLFGVCGHGRERFEAELERLQQHQIAILLIEASPHQILDGFERSYIRGDIVLASVLSWVIRYGLSVVFAGDRAMARAFCQRLLEQAAVEHLRAEGKLR